MTEQRSQSGVGKAPTGANSLDQTVELIDAMQTELNSLRDQLAWSNRLSSLGTLAATLAHEINNLMTPVGLYAQLALKDLENKDNITKALQAAVRGTEQARDLASATLGFAGPEASTAEPTCQLSHVVEQSLACTRPTLQRSETQIKLELDDAQLAISALSLQQVLVNLISNAERAMREQTGLKQISIRSKQQGDQVLLTIEDTGPGIPQSIQESLFDPFVTDRSFHTSVSNSGMNQESGSQQDGTGLGLSICRTLVESAGGQILLGESSESGACFEITLPCTASEND